MKRAMQESKMARRAVATPAISHLKRKKSMRIELSLMKSINLMKAIPKILLKSVEILMIKFQPNKKKLRIQNKGNRAKEQKDKKERALAAWRADLRVWLLGLLNIQPLQRASMRHLEKDYLEQINWQIYQEDQVKDRQAIHRPPAADSLATLATKRPQALPEVSRRLLVHAPRRRKRARSLSGSLQAPRGQALRTSRLEQSAVRARRHAVQVLQVPPAH